MKLVFDIGMYTGSDTEYYLSEGYRVVAVEANEQLIKQTEEKFREEISSGKLILVHAAICEKSGEEITLTISGDNLGASSIDESWVANQNPIGKIKVRGMTITELMEAYGRPYFMKIDIEGVDRYGVLPLTKENRPQLLSFEAGKDMEELLEHLQKIGYTEFKAINQYNFLELRNQGNVMFRLKRKVMYWLGYQEPNYIRMKGRFFRWGHSSGPGPWASDGEWQDAETLVKNWQVAQSADLLGGWYDIHAR